MEKAKNIKWFNKLMEAKMLRHDEDPLKLEYLELLKLLKGEVEELEEALTYGTRVDVVFESADVANYAYFIASKIKEEGFGG